MSEKSFEDKLRDSLKDYNSPLDKEEMFQDFLSRSEREENKRPAFWLMLPLLLALISFLGAWWYHTQDDNLSNQKNIVSGASNSGKASSQMAAALSQLDGVAQVMNETTQHKKPASERKEDSVFSSELEGARPGFKGEAGSPAYSATTQKESKKDLIEILEAEQHVGINLPQRTVSTDVPVLESRQVFLLSKPQEQEIIDFSYKALEKQQNSRFWSQTIHLEFSYGHLSPSYPSKNSLASQIDRLGVSAGKEWISPQKWTLGVYGGFARYNLMQDGKMLLQSSYDTLATRAMLSMVQASLNGTLPGIPEPYETGYSLLQYQNALQLGLSLGKLIPIRKKMEAEFNIALSSEYVWLSNGEWSNVERGIYLDYKFEDYNALAISLRTNLGLRMHLTHENFMRLGVNYQRDLSDRRSDSDLFGRFNGLGFYLGLGKIIH